MIGEEISADSALIHLYYKLTCVVSYNDRVFVNLFVGLYSSQRTKSIQLMSSTWWCKTSTQFIWMIFCFLQIHAAKCLMKIGNSLYRMWMVMHNVLCIIALYVVIIFFIKRHYEDNHGFFDNIKDNDRTLKCWQLKT